MLSRVVYAALLLLFLAPAVSASCAVSNTDTSDPGIPKESNEDVSQEEDNESLFYKEDYEKGDSIVKQITGEMSDSRKMGIGALLVLIGSVLYAGFNWNEQPAF